MSWDNNDTTGGQQWNGGGADSGDAAGFDNGNTGFNDAGPGGDDGSDRPHGACFNCGENGHNKIDCPEPRVLRCRHCNMEGHGIRNCPDPDCPPQEEREFTGECRLCGTEGHRAADCPDRPPMMCHNCGQEGHEASACEAPRLIDRSHVADVNPESAWSKIAEAAKERDMDDVKEAILEYLKSFPDMTFPELEQAFRTQDMGVYIIAVEKDLIGALTRMDLQGNLDKKFTVTYRFDPKPARQRERANFPENTADNMERLKDAGEPVSSGKMKCNNCDEYGHMSKACPSDKIEKEQVVVKCFNCGEEGHRVRDCPTPRVDKFACRNCSLPGHKVSDCPEPPNPANVDCRKCGEKGHFSRDCPQGGGGGSGGGCHNCGQEGHRAKECTEPKKIICRNCDAEGHTGRECPKPRDYSRVKCSNCGEMGHTKVRCKQPVPDENSDEVGGDPGAEAAGTVPDGGDMGDDFGNAVDKDGDDDAPSNGFGSAAW